MTNENRRSFISRLGLLAAGLSLKPAAWAVDTNVPKILVTDTKMQLIMQWTKEFVHEHVLLDDAAVEAKIATGELTPLRTIFPPLPVKNTWQTNLCDEYVAMSMRMGITPAVPVYINMSGASSNAPVECRRTKAGKKYIEINSATLVYYDHRLIKAMLGHELGHIKNGDVAVEKMIENHNNPETARKAELKADEVGSGPLGTNDPLALRDALVNIDERERKGFFAAHPQKSQSDYEMDADFQDIYHPPLKLRTTCLEAQAERQKLPTIAPTTNNPIGPRR